MQKIFVFFSLLFITSCADCDPNHNTEMKSIGDTYNLPCGEKVVSADYTKRDGLRVVTRKHKKNESPRVYTLFVNAVEGNGDKRIKECAK